MCLLASCCGNEFISDRRIRRQVDADYRERQQLFAGTDIDNAVNDASLSQREREALQFLYAYMPLGDAINFDSSYYVENIRLSEQARADMPWGATIPEAIYRHFVLPVRANNENIDDARKVFFAELSERVKGLAMADAVLEVNHWCHEKATYTPTDSRTSSPLATILTAAGRCGEESTLLVAALRAVCIPARQVYTPRWAHTDDNHAWVEAWVDGEWHFLGACEPEAVLDLGWFNAPASRAMLLHTNVFGRYNGPEDTMYATRLTTEINITDNYAPVAPATVRVVDTEGNAVDGATVEYKVYNYSELYSIASKTTSADGSATASLGLGDALIWASKEGRYGFVKVSFGKDKEATIRLGYGAGDHCDDRFFIIPPAERCVLPPVSDEQRAENNRRLAVEDSLRNAYIATFRTPAQASVWARQRGLDADRTARLTVESKGNYAEVERFLEAAASDGMGERAVELLEAVSGKDLHDTPCSVFDDHLRNSVGMTTAIANPRVRYELLTPYRAELQRLIPAELADDCRRNPQLLVEWCRDSLQMADAHCNSLVPISPVGVWHTRVADKTARNLFFVAACRSLGIEAWSDVMTRKVRYRLNGTEYDVDFEAPTPEPTDYGTLKLNFKPSAAASKPEYYGNFTISRMVNGRMSLLNINDEQRSLFGEGLRLEAGDYALVSGHRFDGGEAAVALRIFTVAKNTVAEVDLTIPDSAWAEPKSCPAPDTRRFDTSATYTGTAGKSLCLNDALAAGCRVIGVIGAGQEPTNHLLHDIAKCRAEIEGIGATILLLFADESNARLFKPSDYPSLPSNLQFGTDTTGDVSRALAAGAGLSRVDLPVVVTTDAEGRISFVSAGYSIGLGERIVRELDDERR